MAVPQTGLIKAIQGSAKKKKMFLSLARWSWFIAYIMEQMGIILKMNQALGYLSLLRVHLIYVRCSVLI